MSALTRNLKSTATVLIAGVLLLVGFYFASSHMAGAATQQDLLQQTQELEEQIKNNEKKLEGIEAQKRTLENKLASLRLEIENASNQIDLTQTKIDNLTLELKKTEAELARQKSILRESIRTLYIEGDVTTLELLLGSDNFSEFFNQQEYLETLKLTVQESANKVEDLKKQIEAEKAKQEELLKEQKAQKRVLDQKRDEQQTLLQQTRGQEAKYQSIVKDLEEKLKEAELALAAFIAGGNFVNLGPVAKGEVVGTVGSTGYSTGPHLHFEVRDLNGGQAVNPMPFLNSDWTWPVPATSWQINQPYGCVPNYWYVTPCANGSVHPGVDTGYGGTAVVAAASGAVIARGCSQDYLGTPAYGYIVMINHGNGYASLYAHMLPPDVPQYSHCNYSYGF